MALAGAFLAGGGVGVVTAVLSCSGSVFTAAEVADFLAADAPAVVVLVAAGAERVLAAVASGAVGVAEDAAALSVARVGSLAGVSLSATVFLVAEVFLAIAMSSAPVSRRLARRD